MTRGNALHVASDLEVVVLGDAFRETRRRRSRTAHPRIRRPRRETDKYEPGSDLERPRSAPLGACPRVAPHLPFLRQSNCAGLRFMHSTAALSRPRTPSLPSLATACRPSELS